MSVAFSDTCPVCGGDGVHKRGDYWHCPWCEREWLSPGEYDALFEREIRADLPGALERMRNSLRKTGHLFHGHDRILQLAIERLRKSTGHAGYYHGEDMSNPELEKKAEQIARRIAVEQGYPASLWELFLMPAYDELRQQDASEPPCEACAAGYPLVIEICWKDHPEWRGQVALACRDHRGYGHVVPPELGNAIVRDARRRHGDPEDDEAFWAKHRADIQTSKQGNPEK